ncbi:MAG: Omp28-related outer membrane protein, partial [Saprospiraceae bacterium]
MFTNLISKSISFICLLSFGIGLLSCDEQKRVIVPFVPAGNRVVLLEEFTGKGCTNCPKGSREIENLLTLFPNNLVAVSLHAGFFADPAVFQIGQYDLRTPEGETLYAYIGAPLGYPSGVIDRTPVGGEMQLSANQWSSAISAAIQEEPAVDLSIERTYDVASRLLTVTVNGIGKANVTGDIRVSVMITESGIIDAQDDLEA